MSEGLDRRSLLVAAAALLAGCGTGPETDRGTGVPARDGGTAPPTDGTTTETVTGGPPTATARPASDDGASATATPTTTTTSRADGPLDLREANVTGVAVERSGADYRFDVTLYHDDDGEDGYANWWQVETLGGERLGRRELLHAHGTREFTRSDAFSLPDVDCVVVRGHDQTHGYGGQAMLVTLASGATRAVRQGSDPRSFADATCP